MRKSTILLSTAAVMVLSAGWVLGRLTSQLNAVTAQPHPPTTQAAVHPATQPMRGWFPDQLGLTPEQDKNMNAIWEDARAQMAKDQEKRKALDHDRDTAIKTLLTAEQSAKYDKIFEDYHAGRAELDKDHEKLMHTAMEKSRALLTPEQRAKFDTMANNMHDRDHHGGPGGPGGPGGHRGNGGGGNGGPNGGATTQPGPPQSGGQWQRRPDGQPPI